MKLKSLLLSLTIFAVGLNAAGCSCSNRSKKDSSESDTSEADSHEQVDDYETWLGTWSKSGHVYFHYNRGSSATLKEYQGYCFWIWQHKPQDLAGSLWGYGGKTDISSSLTLQPMSTHFMYGSEVGETGSTEWIDQYGVICDIDLNANITTGKSGGGDASLLGATELGFLAVQESSMGGTTHWTSDGGKNTYITEFNTHFRSDGSMHVFFNKGNLDGYYFYTEDSEDLVVNPVTDDTTGKYRSENDDIVDNYGLSSTAEAFKSLGVGYQVFVASFRDSDGDGMGDIRGIINSLDYLKDLGAQVLWLTPIQESDSYHGYDISDYYAVDSKFGTTEDYRELIYKAHEKGMKVLMDLVLNHTSKSNVWFEKSQWAEKSNDEFGNEINWRNMYHWKYASDEILKYNHSSGKYETTTVKQDAESTNPSWYRDGESNYYYYGKFGSGMPEINYENQATRNIIKNMAKYWLSFGLDGFRLDAVKHIYMKDEVADTGTDVIITDVGSKTAYDNEMGEYITKDFDYSSDLTKNVAWWKEFAGDLKATYPNCFLVGENFDGWGTRTATYYQALDSQFDFSAYYHIAQYLYANPSHYGSGGASAYAANQAKETFVPFASSDYFTLGDTGVSIQGGKRSDFIDGAFTSNHDLMRAINHVNGTWASSTDTTDVQTITGTAEQIGRAKVHAAVTMLTPGISWIYYGDELGMSSNTEQHVEKYKNENSMDIWYRQPFLWGDDTQTGYQAGGYTFELDSYNKTLDDVTAQKADPNSMYNFYKALCEVKQAYPYNAKCTFNTSGSNNVLIMDITGTGSTYRIFINTGLNTDTYGVGGMTGGYTLFKNIGNANTTDAGAVPYSVLVYKK